MNETHKNRGLADYQAKRDFDVTPEPRGLSDRRIRRLVGKKRFFCVQKHLATYLHYDFRLEHEGVLLSWAVPKGPSLNPADKRLAMRVEDHPIDYGDFEGVIPEGYGAGIVMLWDYGFWQPEDESQDINAALAKGQLKLVLGGFKLKGSWVLVRTPARGERSWLLIKHRDEWAGELDIQQFAPLSVKTQRDMPEILAAENPSLWQSNQPVKGGHAGKLLREIIDQAARIQLQRESKPARKSRK